MLAEKQIRWNIGVAWNPKIKNHRRDDFFRLAVAGEADIVM